jgi:hypothetical protein
MENNKNTSISTIQKRLFSIKKLMELSNLEITNPLNNVDETADTDVYIGQKDKENKSLDSRTVLGKKSLNFYKVINRLLYNVLVFYFFLSLFGWSKTNKEY